MNAYPKSPEGYVSALASVGGDAGRVWVDVDLLRTLPPLRSSVLPSRAVEADDFHSIQDALDYAGKVNGGACVILPPRSIKIYPENNSAALRVPDGVYLLGIKGMSELVLVTDDGDLPDTPVSWDAVLFSGAREKWSGIVGVRIRHQGGARINTGSISVRNGAGKVEILENEIDQSISSAIVIEGSVSNPYPTYCLVSRNKISNTVRHGVYLSGSTNNRVLDNFFTTTHLESVVLRNAHDNEISGNTIVGDGFNYPKHAIALAQPPSGTYEVKRLSVKNNTLISIPGSGFYGQGVGTMLTQSTISHNVVSAMHSESETYHALMLFRTTHSIIEYNKIYGGRNRGIMFYGCSNNIVRCNNVTDVVASGADVGAIGFVEYSDNRDSTTTYSTSNEVTNNVVVDERQPKAHAFGIQFTAGSTDNLLLRNTIIGTRYAKIVSADGFSKQRSLPGVDKVWSLNNVVQGTSSSQMVCQGEFTSEYVSQSGWIRSLSVSTRQPVTSGTLRCRIQKNGTAWHAVEIQGNGSLTNSSIFEEPNRYICDVGDKIDVYLDLDGVTSSDLIDVMFRVCIVSE